LRTAASEILREGDVPLVEAEGEAAFYDPKLDLQVRDGRGHEESIATVQLDFSQPDRFDLTYNAADGTRERVVMIHRGTVGAMERVVAVLLEYYQGRLPLWLAAIQVCVLPVGPAQEESARAMLDDLYAAGLRANIEVEGSLGARVHASRQRRDCVIAVIGASEVAVGDVQVIDVAADFKGSVCRAELLELLHRSHATRARCVDWPGRSSRISGP